MSVESKIRARIICRGLVQGVGFRYFVFKQASKYNAQGYAKNLANGEVEILVEGMNSDIEKLHSAVKQGPSRSNVTDCTIEKMPFSGDLIGFDII
jgi:acylphosphatase